MITAAEAKIQTKQNSFVAEFLKIAEVFVNVAINSGKYFTTVEYDMSNLNEEQIEQLWTNLENLGYIVSWAANELLELNWSE